jgi:serine/threonine protein kinase
MRRDCVPNSALNPAECLTGEVVAGEWRVLGVLTAHPLGTGGHFSVGYVVESEPTGRRGFLKAFDFSAAFQAEDFARALQRLTASFNFERELLSKCRDSRMRRVVSPIADGVHAVAGCAPPLDRVHYLIFELADGDIRRHAAELTAIDVAWCLRSLHHTAVGIQELHSRTIMHQDLKPSNVLTFPGEGSKIADLGRGFSPEHPAEHDSFRIPGDRTYAPPELFYGMIGGNGTESRKAIDVYALGSLIFFHFTGLSATQGMSVRLRAANANLSSTQFDRDLPLFQAAFGEVLGDLETAVMRLAPALAPATVQIARELCEPDPQRRGDPRSRAMGKPYSVERYVSRLNLLARRAELRMT